MAHMLGSLVEIVTGAILFAGSIVAVLVMRPAVDGTPRPLALMPGFSVVIPVAIVSGLAAGGAILVAAVFPIFFK
jgi:hypothetical protein